MERTGPGQWTTAVTDQLSELGRGLDQLVTELMPPAMEARTALRAEQDEGWTAEGRGKGVRVGDMLVLPQLAFGCPSQTIQMNGLRDSVQRVTSATFASEAEARPIGAVVLNGDLASDDEENPWQGATAGPGASASALAGAPGGGRGSLAAAAAAGRNVAGADPRPLPSHSSSPLGASPFLVFHQ